MAEHTPVAPGERLCRACKLDIPEDARVCTKCGQSQTRLGQFSVAIKWIGGVATVLSVIAGMNGIYGLYQNQQETRAAVEELADAADRLRDLGDYFRAWDLYTQAAELDPVAPRVRRGQEALVKDWLPNAQSVGEYDLGDVVERSVPVLLRGLGRSQGADAADFQALLAWATHLEIQHQRHNNLPRKAADVRAMLRDALEVDPDNALAHMFLGHRILSDRPETVDALKQGVAHTERALEAGGDPALIRRYQWSALRNLRYSTSGDDPLLIELGKIRLRMVADMIAGEETVRREIGELPYETAKAYGPDFSVEHFDALWPVLTPDDHRRVLDETAARIDNPNSAALQQARLVRVLVDERDGALDRARAGIDTLEEEIALGHNLRAPLEAAYERLTGETSRYVLLREDPAAFHAATLREGDPAGDDFNRALDYVDTLTDKTLRGWVVPQWPVMIAALEDGVARLDDRLAGAQEGADRSEDALADRRWFLARKLGRAQLFRRRLDAAVETLAALSETDAPDAWEQTVLLYDTACAYSLRSATHGAGQDEMRDADRARAVAFFRRAVDGGYDKWGHIKEDKDLDAIRDHPDYMRLMAGR